jgi:ATP-binding cassette subfamily B protein
LLALAWRLDRRRFVIGAGLLLLGSLATPVIALSLKGLVNAAVGGAAGSAARWGVAAAVALLAELMLGHFAHLYYFELAEVTEQKLTRDLLRAVNGTRDLDQCDDPAFEDRIDLVRQDVLRMRSTIMSGLPLLALVVQMLVTAVVLGVLSPLLLLLPVIAVVPVALGKRAEQHLETAREEMAPVTRAIRQYRTLASSPSTQKEIRLSGSAMYLVERQAKLLGTYRRTMNAAQRRHAVVRAAGQLVFGLAYVASVFYVFRLARSGAVSLGDVVLVVTLATQISVQMATGLELLGSVHASAGGVRRLLAIVEESRADTDAATAAPITLDRLSDGVRFERVGFTYPGSNREVLHEVDLHLPAGTAVALVGENGAGKSTLIKLLNCLYAPTSGRVLVDGIDLATTDVASWRKRTASLFQDFARLDLSLQHSVGVGHLPDVESPDAVTAAMHRARAGAVLERIGGPDTLLGSGYGDGTDLSGGQWQSVGFARTLMRDEPLLLTLDEPASALDALAEQRLCDAYQQTAHEVAARVGGVTVFVTHRMSTVRLADLIVVLEAGRVVETGTHAELLAHAGRYAELFRLQSRAYAD